MLSRLARATLVPALLAAAHAASAQQDPFVGIWQGALPAGPMALRLALEVRRDSSGALAGALTSVDQGGARLAAAIARSGDSLVAVVPAAGVRIAGVLAPTRDTLRATFTQNGATIPLAMPRVAAVSLATPPARPQ